MDVDGRGGGLDGREAVVVRQRVEEGEVQDRADAAPLGDVLVVARSLAADGISIPYHLDDDLEAVA